MSRSKWKYKIIPTRLSFSSKKVWNRDLIISQKLIGRTISIYNGNTFVKLNVNSDHVGYKVGEFAFTRKHTKKEARSKK